MQYRTTERAFFYAPIGCGKMRVYKKGDSSMFELPPFYIYGTKTSGPAKKSNL